MARTTKQLSGGGKDKFLRGLVAGVPGLPADAADRVGAALSDGIAEVRVRRDIWDAQRTAPVTDAAVQPVQAKPSAPESQVAKKPVAPISVQQPATPAIAFDPFAFSAVALLTKKGKAALAAALETIGGVDDLRAFAAAQHLALDPAVTDAAVIRTTLVAATERRIAERKAAAS